MERKKRLREKLGEKGLINKLIGELLILSFSLESEYLGKKSRMIIWI